MAGFLQSRTGSQLRKLVEQPNTTLALYLALLAFIVYAVRAIFRAYASPLRQIPGPFLAKFSSLPFAISGLRLAKCFYVHDAFKAYGPVVRIAPNVVVSNDRRDIKTIYGSVKVLKSPFYDAFGVINNERSCLGLIDPMAATHRRKCYLPLFSRKNILQFAPKIYGHLQGFIEKLKVLESRGEAVNGLRWWRYLTFDVVTDLAWGGNFQMVATGEHDHPFLTETDNAATWGFITGAVPLITYLPNWLLPATWLLYKQNVTSSLKPCFEALDNWKSQLAEGTLDKSRVDCINILYKHGEQYPDEKLSDAQIIAAIQEIMVAGSDTTALTASLICYELAKDPESQERLYQALQAANEENSSTPYNVQKLEAFENCKYLDAVCKEGLRKHPSVITVLERVAPKTGLVLGDKKVPAGTIVAMQSHSRHLDPEIYPEPEAWKPERWFNETAEMRESMLAFSTGPRSCVGLNLAHLQLRLYLGTVLKEFRVSLHPSTTEESMKKIDSFLGRPVSSKCLVYFTSRKK